MGCISEMSVEVTWELNDPTNKEKIIQFLTAPFDEMIEYLEQKGISVPSNLKDIFKNADWDRFDFSAEGSFGSRICFRDDYPCCGWNSTEMSWAAHAILIPYLYYLLLDLDPRGMSGISTKEESEYDDEDDEFGLPELAGDYVDDPNFGGMGRSIKSLIKPSEDAVFVFSCDRGYPDERLPFEEYIGEGMKKKIIFKEFNWPKQW